MKNIIVKAIWLSVIIGMPFLPAYSQKIVIDSAGDAYVIMLTQTDYHNAYKYSKLTKALTSYYQIAEQDICHANFSSIDPTGSRIAVFVGCRNQSPHQLDNIALGYYRLIIIKEDSKNEIMHFDNVGHFYSFSPRGDSIVYAEEIAGERGSPSPPGYRGGIWIYDFRSQKTKKISEYSLGESCDLNWSEYDGNIYIQIGKNVERYNVSKCKMEKTAYNGIYFSWDGKYYVATPPEPGTYCLYRTSDNQEIVEWENAIKAVNKDSDYIYFDFWSKKFNAVVFRITGAENVIFDIGKGKVVGQFYGLVIGANAEGSYVAVHPVKPDNKNAYDQTQVEILNLVEIISKYQPGK